MSLGDWFRRIFSAPVESAEEEAVRREEFGGEDVPLDPRLEQTAGGAVMPGLPASQPGEVIEAEQAELEPPPDPAP